jgi:hypothetical protein
METSENSLDNIVRRKHKLNTFAVISVTFVCVFSIGLMAANLRLAKLNQNQIDQLTQQHSIMEEEQLALSSLRKELEAQNSEVKALKKLLKAEKTISQSLKEKLANTLKLLANVRESANTEKSTITKNSLSFTDDFSDSKQTENNNNPNTLSINNNTPDPMVNEQLDKAVNVNIPKTQTNSFEESEKDMIPSSNSMLPSPSETTLDKVSTTQKEASESPAIQDSESSQPTQQVSTSKNILPIQPADSSVENISVQQDTVEAPKGLSEQ